MHPLQILFIKCTVLFCIAHKLVQLKSFKYMSTYVRMCVCMQAHYDDEDDDHDDDEEHEYINAHKGNYV